MPNIPTDALLLWHVVEVTGQALVAGIYSKI